MRNFADQSNRLLRWNMKLSEFDFIVEHRLWSNTGHVDALSRHVDAVKHGAALSKELVLREHDKDVFLYYTDYGNIQ